MDQEDSEVEAQNNEKEPRTTKNKMERWHPETGRYPVDESDDRQKRMATNWRGLCPEMDVVKLKMVLDGQV